MKISYISDLHLEFGDLELPGGDILVLAGDVAEVKNIEQTYDPAFDSLGADITRYGRPDRARRFFIEECAKYRQVFYVMGNHEHYHAEFLSTEQRLRAVMPDNVRLMELDDVTIDGVRFLGCSLWTDLNNDDPSTAAALRGLMNDYRVVKYHNPANNAWHKLTPDITRGVHRASVNWLKDRLREHRDMPTVVITHHAPSFQSIHRDYVHDKLMNGGYASNLEQMILDHSQIKFWIHGHIHQRQDYRIGQCRVIANPRGYQGYEHMEFDPACQVEI
jgi:Icc-related predicted phosphoesterase